MIVRAARPDLFVTLDWPPGHLVHQLVFRVRRVHAGDLPLRGKPGEVVDLIAYTDTAGRERRIYQLSGHGVFIGEYRTPDELGKLAQAILIGEQAIYPTKRTARPDRHPLHRIGPGAHIHQRSCWAAPWGDRQDYYLDATA